jgi:hypothetical protein
MAMGVRGTRPAATTPVVCCIDRRGETAPAPHAENVRILLRISGRFIRTHSLRPHSAKTYENPVRGTACRNTDEFPVPVAAALIDGFSACPRKWMT